jgi:hypothetical protein
VAIPIPSAMAPMATIACQTITAMSQPGCVLGAVAGCCVMVGALWVTVPHTISTGGLIGGEAVCPTPNR